MKSPWLLAVLVLVSLSTSCVPLSSLYPLWTEQNATELPGLEGTWTDGGDLLRIAKDGQAKYQLTYSTKDGVSRYQVHAVPLKDRMFLDFYPDALDARLKGEAYLPLIPVHFFGQIVLNADSLELRLLDDEKVAQKVQNGQLDVPLLKYEDGALLTTDTKGLQTLVDRFADDPALWGEPSKFTRKSPDSSAPIPSRRVFI